MQETHHDFAPVWDYKKLAKHNFTGYMHPFAYADMTRAGRRSALEPSGPMPWPPATGERGPGSILGGPRPEWKRSKDPAATRAEQSPKMQRMVMLCT